MNYSCDDCIYAKLEESASECFVVCTNKNFNTSFPEFFGRCKYQTKRSNKMEYKIESVADIDDAINEIITNSKKTIKEISRETGVSENLIYQFRTGTRGMSKRSIIKILNAYGFDLIIKGGNNE